MQRTWYEWLTARLAAMNDGKGYRLFGGLIKWGGQRMIRRELDEEEVDYLERFYILSTPFLGIYIHRFWCDDDDGLHDHPWHSLGVVLEGAYNEEMPERQGVPYGPTITKLRQPWSLMRPWRIFGRSKYSAHRVTVPNWVASPPWTLFIRFGFKRRPWGFYRDRGWEAAEVQSREEELAITKWETQEHQQPRKTRGHQTSC
jgi:hypothetical protein